MAGPARAARCWRRACAVLGGPAMMLAGAAPASAGPAKTAGPAALNWITLKDSHGNLVWSYEMSLDRGGVTAVQKMIYSFFIDVLWQIYLSFVVFAIWFIDYIISFDWLKAVATPFASMSRSLHAMLASFGVVPTFLTLTAVTAGLWIFRGRWATGVFEMTMAFVIGAVAIGAFADPVQTVSGDRGLIIGSRDAGLQIASGLTHDGDMSVGADELRAQLKSTMVDTFVREPYELVNFATVLDGTPCEKDMDGALKSGPHGTDPTIRKSVEACDAEAGHVAGNPNAQMVMSILALMPAAALIWALALGIALALLFSGTYAVYQALKLVLHLVVGLLPGGARAGLWRSVADLVIALLGVVATVVFLAGYELVQQSVAKQPAGGGGGVMQTFVLIDVLIVIALIALFVMHRRLKQSGQKLAALLATRPGAAPSALPPRKSWARDAGIAGDVALRGANMLGSRRGNGYRHSSAPPPPDRAASGQRGSNIRDKSGRNFDGSLPPAPSGRASPAALRRLAVRAAATGGTGAVAGKALAAARQTARRSAVSARLRAASLTPVARENPPGRPAPSASASAGSSAPGPRGGPRQGAGAAAVRSRTGAIPSTGSGRAAQSAAGAIPGAGAKLRAKLREAGRPGSAQAALSAAGAIPGAEAKLRAKLLEAGQPGHAGRARIPPDDPPAPRRPTARALDRLEGDHFEALALARELARRRAGPDAGRGR